MIGFNTAEGWLNDMSPDVFQEIRHRCDIAAARCAFNFRQDLSHRHEGRYRDAVAVAAADAIG
jgi:hypothetical protein